MAKRGNNGMGGVLGRVLLTAAIAAGGLFLGVRWSDRAVALLDGTQARHVVELIPPEEVTGQRTVRRSRSGSERTRPSARRRANPAAGAD